MANKSSAKIPLFEALAADHRDLDLGHLRRQTMGDEQLAAEILSMFIQQCENCVQTLDVCESAHETSQLAHQMKGCARAVGAVKVAAAAEFLEEGPSNIENLNSLRNLCISMQELLNLRL